MNKSHIHLYTAPGCSICTVMKKMLEQLLTRQKIKHFLVTDISKSPEIVEKTGVKSVPWIELGQWVFIGQQTEGEILHWLGKRVDQQGIEDYFTWQMRRGQLNAAEISLKLHPDMLHNLLDLMSRQETGLPTRIGIMALLEGFQGRDELKKLYPQISTGLQHEDARIRVDFCQILVLSGHEHCRTDLLLLTQDEHPEVQETATDALIEMGEIPHQVSFAKH